MTKITPSLDELETLVDRHGSDFRRWPEADAASARLLFNESPEARQILDAARALDRLLDDALPAPASVGMARKGAILDRVRNGDAFAGLIDWFRRGPWLWCPVAMALVPLVIGFVAGLGLPDAGTNDDELIAELHVLAFDGVEEVGDAERNAE